MTATREGFKKRGVDVVGFWNPDLGEIVCIPRAAKLFDSNLDEQKPSTLLLCELTEPCSAILAKDEDDDAQPVVTKAGDLVGIWAKPGMTAIKSLCGVPVLLQYDRNADGTVKTKAMKKKGMNPMKLFDVQSASNPMRTIPVLEDARKASAGVDTLLAPAKVFAGKTAPVGNASAPTDDGDDVPF
jgi:hypothetical protein